MSSDGAVTLMPAPTDETRSLSAQLDRDVRRVLEQTIAIQRVMKSAMQPGVHYGVIPGTEKKDEAGNDISKPSLFQAGADKLCLLFRLRPIYRIREIQGEDFIRYRVRCLLKHIPTGEIWGEGHGAANNREQRYLNQQTARVCPNCKQTAIMRSKYPKGAAEPGWYCNQKKGGCGGEWAANAKVITEAVMQLIGWRSWDHDNTLLKMACKRSKTGAVLTCTAASDIFTQDLGDLEDMLGDDGGPSPGDAPPAKKEGNGKPNGNGKGKAAAPPAQQQQRGGATPNQIRDLSMAFGDALVGVDEAEEKGFKGVEREEFVTGERLKFCGQVLGREVTAYMDMTPQEVDTVLTKLREGGK